ncbi:MAG: RNA-binding transcriptional accessory protein [Spirochaetes bacterium]|nr:MAG: RNA-binding transcriptional accessory protein [Spirochaetota bacterium]
MNKNPAHNTLEAVKLLDEGATIPFIARYRKEITGNMDEVQLIALRDKVHAQRELDARRNVILKSLTERDLLSADLEKAVQSAVTKTALEDIYLPHRPKRRTRAMAAKEAGFEPLAEFLLNKQNAEPDTAKYGNPEEALSGARDILAEGFSEDAGYRSALRKMSRERGFLTAKVIAKRVEDEEASVYRDYFDYSEKISRVPSHRILAVLRGGKEGYLRVKARLEEEQAVEWLERRIVKGRGACAEQVKLAIKDGWNRLMAPGLETDLLKELKERADAAAIKVFTRNLENMLLSPPLGTRALIAVDPGYRTGGKVAALDSLGKLLDHGVIHPEGSENARQAASEMLQNLSEKYRAEVFAVGNGTAGRETQEFIQKSCPGKTVISVDERGASVYSASKEARREFGDLDITIRGAVSIGRRLQDPLAELVKIEPEAIGVGQYQHDVDAKALSLSLDDTVKSAVNAVGVELNSASAALLSRVSGLGAGLAQSIVKYREDNGPYSKRSQLLKVPRLGAKAFEQAAGFLRIRESSNPLDSSAVHPERYPLVKKMAADLDVSVAELIGSGPKPEALRKQIRLEEYSSESEGAGLPTLKDIMAELARPGRDPRGTFELFSFDERIRSLDDVEKGMVLPGIVTNVTAFGAFVDVGAHRDGLVHISQIANRYVSDPSELLSVNQQVTVKVMEIDRKRGRLGLSIKEAG